MKKEHLVTILLLLVVWTIGASLVHNDILIPYPHQVLQFLVDNISTSKFWLTIGITILRTSRGFLLSLFCALVLSICCFLNQKIYHFFQPIYMILKTIPNVSYIILALIWLGAEGSVSIVTCMILFPVFFNSFMNCLFYQDKDILDAAWIYEDTTWNKLKFWLFPLLKGEILHTGKTAASLGFKVGIMAEILGQVRIGIGRSIQFQRLDLNTSGILAWTLVVILISFFFDLLFSYFEKRRITREYGSLQ